MQLLYSVYIDGEMLVSNAWAGHNGGCQGDTELYGLVLKESLVGVLAELEQLLNKLKASMHSHFSVYIHELHALSLLRGSSCISFIL